MGTTGARPSNASSRLRRRWRAARLSRRMLSDLNREFPADPALFGTLATGRSHSRAGAARRPVSADTRHDASTDYRAVDIAPKPITDDVIHSVDKDCYLLTEHLEAFAGAVLS